MVVGTRVTEDMYLWVLGSLTGRHLYGFVQRYGKVSAATDDAFL